VYARWALNTAAGADAGTGGWRPLQHPAQRGDCRQRQEPNYGGYPSRASLCAHAREAGASSSAGGKAPGRTEVRIPPYGRNLLIAGPSGTGKSTMTAGLIERLIDKAYQVCIIDPDDYSTLQARKLGETILVTVHPDHLAPAVLAPIDMVFAIGPSPEETLKRFAGAGAQHFAWPEGVVYVPGSLVAWFVGVDQLPFRCRLNPPVRSAFATIASTLRATCNGTASTFADRTTGTILKAQNLEIFAQIAEGISDSTWMFHLRRSDYSLGFRDAIRDSISQIRRSASSDAWISHRPRHEYSSLSSFVLAIPCPEE
jgi:hypothetical protein